MTTYQGRNVDSTVAARTEQQSPTRQLRVRHIIELDDKREDALDARLKRSQRIQERKLELQGDEARYHFEIERHGLKPTEDTERESKNRQAQLRRIKVEQRRNAEEPLPQGGNFQRVAHFFARHSESFQDIDPELKPLGSRTSQEMCAITAKAVEAWKEERSRVDTQPLPFTVGTDTIKRFCERMRKRGDIKLRRAFVMEAGPSGRLYSGEPELPMIRIPGIGTGEQGFRVPDAAIVFALFPEHCEKALLDKAARYNSPDALSLKERAAKKADLLARQRKAEFELGAWYWRAIEEGFAVPLPDIPVPALLGIAPVEDLPPLNDDAFDGDNDDEDASELPDTSDDLDFG